MKTKTVLLTTLLTSCSFNSVKSNSQASSAENSSKSPKSLDFESLNSFKLVTYLPDVYQKPATVDLTCTNSTDDRVVKVISNKQGTKVMVNAQTVFEEKEQDRATDDPPYMMQIVGDNIHLAVMEGDLVRAFRKSSTILNGESRFRLWSADGKTSVDGTCKGLFSFEDYYYGHVREIVYTKSNKSGVTTFDINLHKASLLGYATNPLDITPEAFHSKYTNLIASNVTCTGGNLDAASGKNGTIICKETKPQAGTQVLNVVKAELQENGEYTAELTQEVFGPAPEGTGIKPAEYWNYGEKFNFNLVILK